MTSTKDIHAAIAGYYSARLREHGPTPGGVDWNSAEGQALRFDQLLRITEGSDAFTMNEIGCGYGALADYARKSHAVSSYHGVDLSADMIAQARALHATDSHATFAVGDRPDRPRDYCVASGIFNVRMDMPAASWSRNILETLELMDQYGARGFAFNALTSYSDPDRIRPDLHYCDPLAMFDHCKKRYSPQIALLHDYGLYEFTILVRKDAR